MKTLLLGLAFLCVIPATIARILPDSGGDFQSAKIIQTVDPIYPMDLVGSFASGVTVRVAIEINPDGQLTDCLALNYPDRGFADAAVSALRQWKFEPAKWQGEPITVCMTLIFNFDVKGVVISMSAFETTNSLLRFMSPRDVYHPCTLRDLDRIPIPLQTVAPAYPQTLAKHHAPVDVTVEFYIDEQGNVRMPHVLGRPSMLASLAVAAVEQWRFEPPTSRGRPVLVCAQQLFRFAPDPGEDTKS